MRPDTSRRHSSSRYFLDLQSRLDRAEPGVALEQSALIRWRGPRGSAIKQLNSQPETANVYRRRIARMLRKKLEKIVCTPSTASVMPGMAQRMV